MSKAIEEIQITTEFIRLDSLLKFAAAVGSGGEAKVLILDGQVQVNNETCLMRTKKLYNGDLVTFNGDSYKVVGAQK